MRLAQLTGKPKMWRQNWLAVHIDDGKRKSASLIVQFHAALQRLEGVPNCFDQLVRL